MNHTTSSSSSANEVAHTVLGILGNIASCLFFMSSLPTILSMVRCKSSGGLSGDLYLLKLFNCMLWCLYGLPFVHPHDLWVWLTNAFGCAFALLYIFTYFLYTATKEKVRLLWKLTSIVTSFTIMVLLLVLLSRSQSQRISVVGTLSSIVSSGMHIALLSQCKKAVQQRDIAFLHPCASMAGFIKGAIWSTYGVVSFDIFILVPNGVGVLIGIIQTILLFFLIKKGALSACNVQDCEDGHQALPKASMEVQKDHAKKQNDQEGVDRTSRRPRSLSLSYDQDRVDSTSRRPRLSLSNLSRGPSFLGIPRQGSIPSSVIIPITLDDN